MPVEQKFPVFEHKKPLDNSCKRRVFLLHKEKNDQ